MTVPDSKTCTKCGQTKPLDEFPKNGHGGRRADCKPCHSSTVKAIYHRGGEKARQRRNDRLREQYAIDPEKAKDAARDWREANPEKHVAMSVAWAKANPEKVRQYKRRWQEANPDNMADRVRRRRIRLAGVESQPYTRREIFDRDGGRCRECRTELSFERYGYEIDHIVPVSLGGADTPANVQLMCRPCNRAKAATLKGQIHLPV